MPMISIATSVARQLPGNRGIHLHQITQPNSAEDVGRAVGRAVGLLQGHVGWGGV